jgi:hypothetical protein
VSVDGLWREKPAEQVSHAAGRLGHFTDNGPMAERVLPAAKSPQTPSRAWMKRVLWFTFGTAAWVLACVGVRHVFGSGAILLESVLLVLILGTVIGLTSLPEL